MTLPERLSPFKVLLPGDALTNGAIALFGKDPYKFFNHCRVRLARFEGTIMDKFRDQAVIDANLFQQLQAIEDFCRKHMFMSGDQDQFDSKNVLTVPLKVVREAALNLLIHRTWWSEGRTPSVNIFDDRVEFMNPGAFPPGTTPADFRHRPHSVLVNEVIANALFKGGKTEGWGRGILDIFTLCKEAGLPEPEYDFVPNFVCLTIRFKNPLTPYLSGDENGGVNGGVNDGVKTLSESLKPVYSTVFSNPGIKANNVAALLDRPLPTVEKQLATLKKKGLIEYRGSAKTGGYYAK